MAHSLLFVTLCLMVVVQVLARYVPWSFSISFYLQIQCVRSLIRPTIPARGPQPILTCLIALFTRSSAIISEPEIDIEQKTMLGRRSAMRTRDSRLTEMQLNAAEASLVQFSRRTELFCHEIKKKKISTEFKRTKTERKY
jgi:hypothetical protein